MKAPSLLVGSCVLLAGCQRPVRELHLVNRADTPLVVVVEDGRGYYNDRFKVPPGAVLVHKARYKVARFQETTAADWEDVYGPGLTKLPIPDRRPIVITRHGESVRWHRGITP